MSQPDNYTASCLGFAHQECWGLGLTSRVLESYGSFPKHGDPHIVLIIGTPNGTPNFGKPIYFGPTAQASSVDEQRLTQAGQGQCRIQATVSSSLHGQALSLFYAKPCTSPKQVRKLYSRVLPLI